MADVVLALQRKWLELILCGVKTAEFRRVMPKALMAGDKVYLYHERALHGVAVVERVDFALGARHEEHDEDCACLARSYEGCGCLGWDAAYAYLYRGRRPGVMVLRDVQRFGSPRVWVGPVVQSFVYYHGRKR